MSDNPTAEDVRWYTPREVENLVKCSRRYIYDLMAKHNFPQPVYLSKRCRRWDAKLVDQWIEERLASGAS